MYSYKSYLATEIKSEALHLAHDHLIIYVFAIQAPVVSMITCCSQIRQ